MSRKVTTHYYRVAFAQHLSCCSLIGGLGRRVHRSLFSAKVCEQRIKLFDSEEFSLIVLEGNRSYSLGEYTFSCKLRCRLSQT